MNARACLTLLAAGLLVVRAEAQAPSVVVGVRQDPSAGIIVGRVCEDRDGDARCGAADPPVPSARVVLDDGTFAVADADGRFELRAIPTRQAQRLGTGDLRQDLGRRWLELDSAAIGHTVEVAGGPGRMLEIAPASLHLVEFPVTFRRQPTPSLTAGAPAHGEVRRERLWFTTTGQVPPGHRLWVANRPVEPNASGAFSFESELHGGENRIPIIDLAPDGELTLYVQPVAVLTRRRSGVLFVPHPFEMKARVLLPTLASAPVGEVLVVVDAPPSSEVRLAGQTIEVGPDGYGRVVVRLEPGDNALAVQLVVPNEPFAELAIRISAQPQALTLATGGIEVGFDPRRRLWTATGRGAAVMRRSFRSFEFHGGINLDATDLQRLTGRQAGTPGGASEPGVLLQPRAPLQFERVLDARLFPPVPGDGEEGSWNPGDQRLWATLRHPRYGAARLGTIRPLEGDQELGAYRRALFGAQLDARLPLAPGAEARVEAFGAPAVAGAGTGEPVPVAAHEVFESTGGSLYYLRHGDAVPGSERVRVEMRDPLTGLAQQVTDLTRGRDYDFDFITGRLLLSRPLPLQMSLGPLLAGRGSVARQPALVVDYQYLAPAAFGTEVLGARVGAQVSGVRVSAGAIAENRLGAAPDYGLYSARASLPAGPVRLDAEAGRSAGALFGGAQDFSFSDAAGLGFISAPAAGRGAANALSLRASVEEAAGGLRVWARAAEPGFSDADHAAAVAVRQYGGRGELRLGDFELAGVGEARQGPDPRDPFGLAVAQARDAAVRGALTLHALTVHAETRAALLRIGSTPGAPLQEGGRLSLSLGAEYRLTRELAVEASHQRRLFAFGSGPGAFDDTFSAVGAAYRPRGDVGLGLRAGWGPSAGTQVQVRAESQAGDETSYATMAVGVDGPQSGQTAASSGARRRVEGAELFVEDFFARDYDGLRAGRAVGVASAAEAPLQLGARYERALRLPDTGEALLLRDALGARAAGRLGLLRFAGFAELRHERGDAVVAPAIAQWQAATGISMRLQPWPAFGIRGAVDASRTLDHGALQRELLEGFLSAALRLGKWALVGSWSAISANPLNDGSGERMLVHLLSLRPAVSIGERFRLAAGVHESIFLSGQRGSVGAASLRPSMRLFGSFEAAAEVAARNRAPAGEKFSAARVEIEWWLQQTAGVALGYNLYGFSGTGTAPPLERGERVYLRVEAGY